MMSTEYGRFDRALTFIGGLAVGTGIAYAFDPQMGRRRRSLVRDRAIHARHAASDVVDKGLRDLSHRARGLLVRARSVARHDDVIDEVLVERVRANIGRVVTHPGSIEVMVENGRVRLAGPVLARELDGLVRCVRRVPGVRDVEHRLEAHPSAENVPGLQGAGRPPRRAWFRRDVWPPSERVLAGAACVLLGAQVLRRRGVARGLLGVTCAALLARTIANVPLRRLVSVRAGAREIDLHKTIVVDAPVEEVFRFWSVFENFPRFMDHVRDVKLSPDGEISRWKVEGPAGIAVGWDARVTERVENRLLAWRTLPDQTVEHAGSVRFEPVGDRRTRLHIRLSYSPPAGALGHAVARLFGRDPMHEMNDDLLRMKSLLETGRTRARGRRVNRDDVERRDEGGQPPTRPFTEG
jgi:uncharacterized membrane protein